MLERAVHINLKLNPKKSKLCKQQVEYVGHIISDRGVTPSPQRIQAINEMPEPGDKAAVQRFLGMINYVHKFIPNLSSIAEPLRVTLSKNVAWHWGYEQEIAFEKLKEALTNYPVLEHYNPKTDITLQVDASKSGLGAVIMQKDKPVALASKALNYAQSQYAVIEKELLAICFGVHRFHDYVYGQQITVQTDHKPLVAIMTKPICKLSARMQRMRLRLQNYNIDVQYINGRSMYFADTLSRAHTQTEKEEDLYDATLSIATLTQLAIDKNEIKTETLSDTTLTTVRQLVLDGWPKNDREVPSQAKPYTTYKDEITIHEDLLMKGERIIIPHKLQRNMIEIAHEGHLGITKTLQLARDFMFWPGMTTQITEKINKCQICQQQHHRLHNETLISHSIPNIPFEKVGADIFEHNKQHYIVIIDYYSKYMEVSKLNTVSSREVILKLQEVFCRYGIPKTVVSDNGPQFAGWEYKKFAAEYGFTAIHSSPHYPRSNGQAERAVQISKQMIKKSEHENQNINIALLNYRNTPIAELNASPAQILFCRRLRSKLPAIEAKLKQEIQTNMQQKITLSQHNQKLQHDKKNSRDHKILQNDTNIRYRNHDGQWVIGKVKHTTNQTNRSYIIENDRGRIIRRNRCQMFPCNTSTKEQLNVTERDNTAKNAQKHTPIRV